MPSGRDGELPAAWLCLKNFACAEQFDATATLSRSRCYGSPVTGGGSRSRNSYGKELASDSVCAVASLPQY